MFIIKLVKYCIYDIDIQSCSINLGSPSIQEQIVKIKRNSMSAQANRNMKMKLFPLTHRIRTYVTPRIKLHLQNTCFSHNL